MGLHRAGFDVVGVDIEPQPRYPFTFVQADALAPPFRLSDFDFIWASPPCQAHTVLRHTTGREYENLIPQTRAMLADCRALTCIENVPGAPLRVDLVLTGGEFDLDIIRRRHFELGGFRAFLLNRQQMRTVIDGGLSCVVGSGVNGGQKWKSITPERRKRMLAKNRASTWRESMGIPWMVRRELSQAIPPAYSEFIGRAAIEALNLARAAA